MLVSPDTILLVGLSPQDNPSGFCEFRTSVGSCLLCLAFLSRVVKASVFCYRLGQKEREEVMMEGLNLG